jgi:hypothetical protein
MIRDSRKIFVFFLGKGTGRPGIPAVLKGQDFRGKR